MNVFMRPSQHPSAFPVTGEHLLPEFEQPGMSLRDYFAAHAPAEPQPWFNPKMRRMCPIVPSTSNLSPHEFDEVNRLLDEGEPQDTDLSRAALAWINIREDKTQDRADWQADFRIQLYLQWPYAWADAMLEQR